MPHTLTTNQAEIQADNPDDLAKLEHAIRDIVGRQSGYAGEQHAACRRLVITAI